MKWAKNFDLFLFDFDGLLVDSERLHYQAYVDLCKRHGYELPWDLNEFFSIAHTSSDGLRKALYPHLENSEPDWAALYSEKKEIYQSFLENGDLSLMPGVEELLSELIELKSKRAVVTNSTKEQVEAIKDKLSLLKTIPLWITREDYERAKPAPDGYLKAMEILSDPGDRVIGFEDTLRGIRSLESASVPAVLLCDPMHPQMKDASGLTHFPSFGAIPANFKV